MVNVIMLIGEHVVAESSGTFSILHGGIDQVGVPEDAKFPIPWQCGVLIRVEDYEIKEKKEWDFVFGICDAEKKDIVPQFSGKVKLSPQSTASNFIFNLVGLRFQSSGNFLFYFKFSGREWSRQVRVHQKKGVIKSC